MIYRRRRKRNGWIQSIQKGERIFLLTKCENNPSALFFGRHRHTHSVLLLSSGLKIFSIWNNSFFSQLGEKGGIHLKWK
jgi:hypothetical protein